VKLVVKDHASMEDGSHTGQISKVEYRNEPFEYTDIFIRPQGKEFELKYGCPTNLSIKSKLGKLLARFTEVKPGLELDPEKILVGKEVTFMTVVEGEFCKVIDESLKPAAQESKAPAPSPGV